MKTLVLCILALFPALSLAQAVPWNEDRLTWTLATTCQDGSPASACPLTAVRVETGPSATGPWTTLATLSGTATTYTRTGAPAGTNWYRVVAVAATGSAASNAVSAVTTPPAPNPPVLTVAEVVAGVTMTPAFRVLADGSRSSVVVGFVTAGTPCIPPTLFRYRGRDYQRVDPARVRWWASSPSPNVAAACA